VAAAQPDPAAQQAPTPATQTTPATHPAPTPATQPALAPPTQPVTATQPAPAAQNQVIDLTNDSDDSDDEPEVVSARRYVDRGGARIGWDVMENGRPVPSRRWLKVAEDRCIGANANVKIDIEVRLFETNINNVVGFEFRGSADQMVRN
jgi:hypothetical protein